MMKSETDYEHAALMLPIKGGSMSDKSEAVQLADIVDSFDARGENMPFEIYGSISSELRRLHEVNQELLEAARKILEWVEAEEDHTKGPDFWPRVLMYREAALATRAAVAKTTGEQK